MEDAEFFLENALILWGDHIFFEKMCNKKLTFSPGCDRCWATKIGWGTRRGEKNFAFG